MEKAKWILYLRYYEGKEFETSLKEKRPGDLSPELVEALSIPPLAPPPWLISMQRFGPPPSYPTLRIPGLNAPIPEGWDIFLVSIDPVYNDRCSILSAPSGVFILVVGANLPLTSTTDRYMVMYSVCCRKCLILEYIINSLFASKIANKYLLAGRACR